MATDVHAVPDDFDVLGVVRNRLPLDQVAGRGVDDQERMLGATDIEAVLVHGRVVHDPETAIASVIPAGDKVAGRAVDGCEQRGVGRRGHRGEIADQMDPRAVP